MTLRTTLAAIAVGIIVLSGRYVQAQEFSTQLSGFEEIGGLGAGETGAILSNGSGKLSLHLNKRDNSISYSLSYSNLSAPVTQAHIHFGKFHVAGGVMVFFCSNLPNPPPGTQACPANGGTVTGIFTGTNVVGPTAQNVTPGDFTALTDALISNTAYANVHTQSFPAGEIRGQIRRGNGEED
jgi:hypothetical protein